MSEVSSLRTLLIAQLCTLYDSERRLARAVSALADASTDPQLQEALDEHAARTETHVARLEQVFDELDAPLRAGTCLSVQSLIEEGGHHIQEAFATDGLRDVAIIGMAQRIEHYEIAAYGTAAAHARLLELPDAAVLLEETLAEEKAMDRTLTAIAQDVVNPGAVESEVFAGLSSTTRRHS